MSRHGIRTAALCWLPVAAVVAALFLVPSSNGAAAPSLTVNPGSGQYGGTSVRWTGNIGSTGEQRIWLQRRGNTTSPWADVPHPKTGDTATFMTDRNGSFDFFFPAPAMNFVYFRVAGRSGATPAHLFKSKHQDADFKVVEHNPADVPLPQTLAIGTAVVGESFSLEINTVKGAGDETKPILPGRDVTLQRRNSDSSWTNVAFGQLGRNNGLLRFGPYDGTPGGLQVPGDYRVRLERYTTDGHDIGWFLSLPFDLRVVTRPEPVGGLAADPTSSSVTLTWRLPTDPRRHRIEIYRTMGADAADPTVANPWQKIADLDASRTSYTDAGLVEGRTYKYAVYTRSPDPVYTRSLDGVYTRFPARVTASTPAQQR